MPAPQPKPKYILKGPRTEMVEYMLYSKEVTKDEVGPLEAKLVKEERQCYMLFIPHGPKGEYNSIRITSPEQLKELGVDPNVTPLIDPETGETVGTFQHKVAMDFGPDPELLTSKSKKPAAE